jgi:hypothetical protein
VVGRHTHVAVGRGEREYEANRLGEEFHKVTFVMGFSPTLAPAEL